MNILKARIIEKKANETRQKLQEPNKSNIDMKELMNNHNISYFEKELPDNTSGASMTTEKGEQIIVANEAQSKNRKKFTIAHELGHLLLGHDTALNTQDKATTKDNQSQILFRNDKSSEGSDWREVEANHFAASLLMPKELLNKEINKIMREKATNYLSENDVSDLANIFEVSTISMSIRLSRLGFI